jgi:hypothetical protein
VGSAKEDVLRCALKNKLDEPDVNRNDLDKKIIWVDGSKYKINLIGERAIKAESDNGNVKISLDRFDGFITLEALSSKFGGYCKKYKKIF